MGQGQPGYRTKHDKYDYYQTPYCLTKELIKLGIFHKDDSLYDPCCGDGAIMKVFTDNGFTITGDDIRTTGKNFLTSKEKHDHIIMNPPFNNFDAFVKKAKETSEGVWACIVKTNFFGAYNRYYGKLWENLRALHIFNRQIEYNQDPSSVKAGMLISGWAIFDPNWKEDWWQTSIIDIQPYFQGRVV